MLPKEVIHEGRRLREEGISLLLTGHVFTELNREGIETMRDLGANMAWLLK